MKKHVVSISIKSLLIIVWAIGMSMSFSGGLHGLLYFTNQSNIWIGLVFIAALIAEIIEVVRKKPYTPPIIYILKYIFTVSITLTFSVFAVLLAPLVGAGSFAMPSLAVHYIVPVLAILDFILHDYHLPRKKYLPFISLLPPIYYLIFALILGANNVVFAGGQTYPYFFLDYKGLGWFDITEKGLGVAYWIILLIIFVLLVGLMFYAIAGVRKKSVEKKLGK